MERRRFPSVPAALGSVCLAAALLACAAAPAAATTWHVDSASGNDATGTGSAAKPFRTITRALSAPLRSGDTIYAAAGTLSAATGEVFPLDFPPNVALTGAGPTVTTVRGVPSAPVIRIAADADHSPWTVVEKVSITGGQDGIVIQGSPGRVLRPVIRDCILWGNARDGIAASGTGKVVAAIERNLFDGNGRWGVSLDGSRGQVDGAFSGNLYTRNGPGGGVFQDSSQPFTETSFHGERAVSNQGDGICLVFRDHTWRQVPLRNLLLAKNTGSGFHGVGPPNDGQTGYTEYGLVNATIADNLGAGIRLTNTYVTAHAINAILWGNGDDIVTEKEPGQNYAPLVFLRNADVGDPVDGERDDTVFSAPPYFVRRSAGDYHLAPTSPCIDRGLSLDLWTGYEVPAADIEGSVRRDDPATPDLGSGPRPWLDLGAYEVLPPGSVPGPATYHVNVATGNDATGKGTAASPWKTITRSLVSARYPGDLVEVAGGVYRASTGERFPLRPAASVKLHGAGAAITVVEGDPSSPVVELGGQESDGIPTVVQGFTLRGGRTGIVVRSSDIWEFDAPEILDNVIERNVGEGIRAGEDSCLVYVRIAGNTIRENGGWGVVLDSDGPSPWQCWDDGASGTFERNGVSGNASGGVSILGFPATHPPGLGGLRFRDDRIQGNGGDGIAAEAYYGGGVTLTNALITGNAGNGVRGVGFASYADPAVGFYLLNSTVADNAGDGVRVEADAGATIANSIVWGHALDVRLVKTSALYDGAVAIRWSDVGTRTDSPDVDCGTGCFSKPPLFLNRGKGDYRLAATSPCIDAGVLQLPGHPDRFLDFGPAPATDIAGGPRFDDPGVPNTGEGPFGWVDLGAFEAAVPAGAGFPRTWRVNAATGSDATGDGSASRPFRTITRALRAPHYPGNSIEVAGGNHDTALGESFPLRLPPSLTLRGAGRDATRILGVAGLPVVELSADQTWAHDSAVRDLEIAGGDPAVRIVAGYGQRSDPLLRDLRIRQASGSGVLIRSWADGIPTARLEGVEVERSAGHGIEMESWTTSYITSGDPGAHILRSAFRENAGDGLHATFQGFVNSAPLELDSCEARGNGGDGISVRTEDNSYGGLYPREFTAVNALLVKNRGAGLRVSGYRGAWVRLPLTAGLMNATLADNAGPGLSVEGDAAVTAQNSVFWGNAPDIARDPGPCASCEPSATILWSLTGDLSAAFLGPGVQSTAPFFVNRGAGNYHLAATSPCIDAGSSDGLVWAAGKPALAPAWFDLEGFLRNDNPQVPNRGGGSSPWLDLGAYESRAAGKSAPPSEPQDSDADGVADAFDCAPADAAVWAPPGPVEGLLIARGADAEALLAWTPQPGALYDVASGDLADLAAGLGTRRAACVASGLSAPSWADRRGGAAYYLVRARNACGPSPTGDTEIERAFALCR